MPIFVRERKTKKMGEIRDMEKLLTAKDIAKTYGVSSRTVNNWFNEIGGEATFDVNAKFPASFWESVCEGRPAKGAKRPAKKRVSNPAPPAPDNPETEPARATWPTLGLSEFLAVAVYGHTALVWFEVWTIFALPGLLAGVVLFALKHAAVTICRREKFIGIADEALSVAIVLDGLAWYAHYHVFRDAMPPRFIAQMGEGGGFWAALVLGGVLAVGAWVCLFLIKKITINKLWQ